VLKVLIDGIPVKDLNVGWLRDHIGVVSQEPILFATTIEENIRFGKEGTTIQDIQKAARDANAHDFVMKLPDVSHPTFMFPSSSLLLFNETSVLSFEQNSKIVTFEFKAPMADFRLIKHLLETEEPS
jgi:ABC-type multidrug transport system fused ATPase/permease subunit